METVFKLHEYAVNAGIKTQKKLIQLLKEEFGIEARPNTISALYSSNIKRLPVELIAPICKLTNTTPGDWITIEDRKK